MGSGMAVYMHVVRFTVHGCIFDRCPSIAQKGAHDVDARQIFTLDVALCLQ